MLVKEFYKTWTEQEIDEYVDQFGVLVLFIVHTNTKEAELVVHGRLNEAYKDKLKEKITMMFGGTTLSDPVCNKINEFAEKWYNKFVIKRKARVINCKKGKK